MEVQINEPELKDDKKDDINFTKVTVYGVTGLVTLFIVMGALDCAMTPLGSTRRKRRAPVSSVERSEPAKKLTPEQEAQNQELRRQRSAGLWYGAQRGPADSKLMKALEEAARELRLPRRVSEKALHAKLDEVLSERFVHVFLYPKFEDRILHFDIKVIDVDKSTTTGTFDLGLDWVVP